MTRSKVDPKADPIDELADLLSPFEQRGMDLSLERMQTALNDLANPCADVPAVQVAMHDAEPRACQRVTRQSAPKPSGRKHHAVRKVGLKSRDGPG